MERRTNENKGRGHPPDKRDSREVLDWLMDDRTVGIRIGDDTITIMDFDPWHGTVITQTKSESGRIFVKMATLTDLAEMVYENGMTAKVVRVCRQ